MIILLPDPWDYYYYDVPIMSGSAHSVSSERPDYDAAEAVRRVAEEVTGQSFAPAKARMGFV